MSLVLVLYNFWDKLYVIKKVYKGIGKKQVLIVLLVLHQLSYNVRKQLQIYIGKLFASVHSYNCFSMKGPAF